MKDALELLRLLEGENLPQRSYRFSKNLMEAVREAAKEILGAENIDDTKAISCLAAYGILMWRALAQQPEKKGGKKKGDLGPGERVGRLGSKPSTHSPATHLKQGGHGNS